MRTGIGTVFACVIAVGCGSKSGGGADAGSDASTYVPPYAQCMGTGQPPAPPAGSLCLVNPMQPPGTSPIAVIEHEFVTYMGIPAVHISVVFDPTFADNTYGANAVGWSRARKFGDLVGSDHAVITVLDSLGTEVLRFNLDYITADSTAPCGYRCLGVDGGDGKLLVGMRSAILGFTSSLDRNLNERGYCGYLTDSPATDENCTPNPAAPDWDFRIVYEVWIDVAAFSPGAFGSAYMSNVHASPSKAATNTVDTTPGECPCIPIDNYQCDEPPGGPCTTNDQCPTEQFCYDGQCLPIIR
jgi:hypothetical protein